MNISYFDTLDKDKLDVTNKTRSNIFNWRGQFTPEFVEYLLDYFVCATSTTFDPFCGSGTLLLESARRNIASIGFEINPAAYAMTRFITFVRLHQSERNRLYESVISHVDSLVGEYNNLPLFESNPLSTNRYQNLIHFARDLLTQIDNKEEKVFALNTLFHIEKTGKGDLIPTIRHSLEAMKKHLFELPYSSTKLTVKLCDARMSHNELRKGVDVIITSPPDINVFNYHQNYRSIIEILGFDMLKVAESEIGANRKNRGNRFRTVIQYALEMEQALASFAHLLKTGGLLILIVGRESNVRGIPLSNSKILSEIAKQLQCYHEEMSEERVFVNRFGKRIKEDILILRNLNLTPRFGKARNIASDQLEKAYERASGEVADDIADAISKVCEIKPSPMFNKKGVI